MSSSDQPSPAASRGPSGSRRMVRVVLLALAPVIALFVGIYFYATGGRYVTTENAYIKSDKVAISTDVSGRVIEVKIVDNQIVKAGTLLFKLDPEPFRIS